MECKWVFIFVTYFITTSIAVYINNTMTDFESARDSCPLATPKIRYSKTGPTVEIGSVDILKIDESAWVGYIKDYEVFRYLGCVHINSVTVQAHTTIKVDVGECKSFCQTFTYFGVTLEDGKAECKCININNPGETIWKHLIPCNSTGSSNVLAFGTSSRLSVYMQAPDRISKILKTSSTWNTKQTYCGCLNEPTLQDYGWYACSSRYKLYCYKDWWQNTSGREYKDFRSWNEAVDYCLNTHTYPYLLSYQPTKLDVSNTQYWTSYVRAHVISNSKEWPLTDSTLYGYIKRTDDRYFLYFEPKSATRSRKAICDDILTSTSQSAKTSTSSYKATRKTIDPKSYSSTESLLTLTGDSKADNENVAVLVAVPLIIVLLIVCGVIGGIFIWRRSKAKRTKADDDRYNGNITNSCEGNELNNDHRPESSDVYNEIGDIDELTHKDIETMKAIWEFEPTRNSVNNTGYLVLEKVQNGQFQVVENNDFDIAKEPERNETTPEDFIQHDSKKILDKKTNLSERDKKTGHDYTKVILKNKDKRGDIGNHNDFDYDHLHQVNKTPNGEDQLDEDEGNYYNKTNENNTVDTYDHIADGIQGKRISFTGNSLGYNALSKTYNKWKDVPLDSDDTYNHVNQVLNGTFDEQPYNNTTIQTAKQDDHVNPYDHARAT